MLEFENVLRQLGSFGPYQRRVFVLVSMFETPVAWAMLLPIFLNVVPEWKCPDSSNASLTYNSSFTSNISFPLSINVKNCSESGLLCPEASFTKEIQTIVSEVGESENWISIISLYVYKCHMEFCVCYFISGRWSATGSGSPAPSPPFRCVVSWWGHLSWDSWQTSSVAGGCFIWPIPCYWPFLWAVPLSILGNYLPFLDFSLGPW